MINDVNEPTAANNPFISIFSDEQHIVYRDSTGTVWDSYYDIGYGWFVQQINLGGMTSGPTAAGVPCFSVYNNEQHVTYRDSSGYIRDAYYNGSWNLQQINLSGVTAGTAAVGDPFVSVYNSQHHFVYRDGSGILQDSYYNAGWYLQEIN